VSTRPKQDFTLPDALIKTIAHFFPHFWSDLSQVKDPRDPTRIVYPMEMELFVGVLFLMLHGGSRRNIKYKLATPVFLENLRLIWKTFYPKVLFPESLFHGDTLHYLLKRIDPEDIHNHLRRPLMRRLLRGRSLEDFRLLGHWYMVMIDGTGYRSFSKPHCPHCLKRTQDHGTVYLHQVLEAKLVLLKPGMALSIETEFIENENQEVSKQDCELKAFHRLAARLKRDFSQLNICLSVDGLYLGAPTIDLCQRNRWHYFITFKEGSAPAFFAEYEALLKLDAKNFLRQEKEDGAISRCRWVNRIDWEGRRVNVLENTEQTAKGETRFVWATDFEMDLGNVQELERGGRARWKIENEGFNVQKNGGYELEHPFSDHPAAMKNFYLLTQIAHLFNQLMEKGSLLGERIRETMGSLKVFSLKMWAAFTEVFIEPARLREILAARIQIRFDTS